MRIPFVTRWIEGKKAAVKAVIASADDLQQTANSLAYSEARSLARLARRAGDQSNSKFWSRVAVEIARREGREIGMTVADRYDLAEREARKAHVSGGSTS